MLVMHDRCDSVADENEADVLKPKHSSSVELSWHCQVALVVKKKYWKYSERIMKLLCTAREGNYPRTGCKKRNQTPTLLG